MEQNTSSNQLETKIQNQFNEEKWTRISAKDISISRFKLLDDIIREASETNSTDFLKNESKNQLVEYDQSVAARYFLGMIALDENRPDDSFYLKQLLDQFQDASKWAVVDYLADKMLAVTEYRTIIRAKALALEKLGKTKEAIPVLEKLATLDRKNPDIALKYADAIINEDLEKSIQFYKQAVESYAKNVQLEKLRNVWNKLVDLIPDDFSFFKKIERILSGHRQKEILADLYVQLAYVYIKKDDVDNIIFLSKKVLEYNPNYTRFKNELIKAYKIKYKDHSLLDDFIKYSGLSAHKKNIKNSIQNFETNIVFDKGNYVFHRSWGVGKIKELDTNHMIIDFKEKESHRMDIQMALKSLKPLNENHLWVYQYEKPEEIQKMFEDNLIEFFKILIASFDNRVSLSDIKAELIDKFVPAKEWSKWWSKVRTEILKDDLIGISPQKKDVIELYDQPITASDRIMEKFQGAQSFDERINATVEALKDPEASMDALEYIIPFFVDSIKSIDPVESYRSIWILDLIKEGLDDEEDYYNQEAKEKLIETFRALAVNEMAIMNENLKNPEMKKSHIKWIRSYYADWQKVYIELLFHMPIKIHKFVMNELIEENENESIIQFFNRLKKDARDYIEIFLWALKNIINENWKIEGIDKEELLLTYFRLLKTIAKVEKKGTKLKNAAREFITGSVKSDFFEKIEIFAANQARKFSGLIADVPFFSDLEKEKFTVWLKKNFAGQFEETEEFDQISDSSVDFLDELEKNKHTFASSNAIRALKDELDHLIKVEIPDNSHEIGVAQEKGDLRENAEYKAALERQTILQASVTRLENQIKTVKPITADQVTIERVVPGCRVRMKDQQSGDIFSYTVLDQWDADVDKGIISYKSPLGQSLLKHKPGENVVFEMANEKQELEIISIEKAVDKTGSLV